MLRTGTWHGRFLQLSFKSMSQEGLCLRKLLVVDLTKKIYITYESMKTWQRKWCNWDWAAMVKVRVFLLGVLFVSKHLNCSGEERFRQLLSPPSELLLTADERRNTVVHRLVLIMDHASRTRLSGIRNFREEWAQAAFFWLKRGSFQTFSSVLKVLLSVWMQQGPNTEHFPSFQER